MKYCSDCKRIFEDNVNVCKICSAKLEDSVADDSYVHIITSTSIEKERIKIVLEDRDIDVQEKKEGKFHELFVKYKDIKKANKIIDDIDAVDLDYKFKNKKKKALAAQRTEENKVDEKEEITEEVTEEKSEENTGEKVEEKSEEATEEKAEEKSGEKTEVKSEKEEKSKTVDKKKSSDREKAKDKEATKAAPDNDDDDEDVNIGEVLVTQDNDRSVYELFGFDKLAKGKRRLTMAVLWILFVIVIFLIIAGVDMGVEFIKGLFE